jgi:tRNA (mo5U34)-methyltransferase
MATALAPDVGNERDRAEGRRVYQFRHGSNNETYSALRTGRLGCHAGRRLPAGPRTTLWSAATSLACRAMGPVTDRVASLPWFHRIPLPDGTVTPGVDIDSNAKLAFNQLPTDLTGKTVLDIGAWDGLFSFACEERGAARVLATDSYAWTGDGWGSKECFLLARELLGSQVEDQDIDVMDISPETVGRFDVVLLLGVLYHLRHPLLALERVASVTQDMLILSTSIDMVSHDRPAAAFYPGEDLNGDSTNWWGPNPACVESMLRDVGFERVEMVSTMLSETAAGVQRVLPHAAAFHAYKA